VVGLGELDSKLPGRRIHAVLVLPAEGEAERRLAAEPGGFARRQVSAATDRACRQHHREDAGHGQKVRSLEEARCPRFHGFLQRRRRGGASTACSRVSGDWLLPIDQVRIWNMPF
jgi:hypothetical protein